MQLFQEMVFLSFLSGIFILLGWAAQKVLGKWYQPVWRYYLWLLLCLRLLIPVDLSLEQAPVRLEVAGIKEAGTSREDGHVTDQIAAESTEGQGISFWRTGMLVWFSGFLVLGLYFVIRYQIQWRRMRRFSLPEMDRSVCKQWNEMLKAQGIRRNIPVYRSEYIYAPVLIGIRKKYLLLPEKHFEGEEREYIFRHEIKHLVYHHMLIKLLGLFLCCVYWYQPMIWLMKREMDRDIEAFCDRKAVQKLDDGERYLYTQTMLHCMTFAKDSPVLVSSGFGGTVGAMKERIRWIMKGNTLKRGIGVFAAFAVIIGVGNCLIAYGGQGGEQETPQQTESIQETDEKAQEMPENVAESTEIPEAVAETYDDETRATESTEIPEAYAEDIADAAEVTENEASEAVAIAEEENIAVDDSEALENEAFCEEEYAGTEIPEEENVEQEALGDESYNTAMWSE